MKKTFLFYAVLSLVSILTFSSCGDDSCVDDPLSEVIVGSWTPAWGSSTVEFRSDGTLIDPNDEIYGVEINGVVYSDKTYTVDSNTAITVRAANPDNASNASDFTLEVTDYDCDRVVFSLFGLSATMNRN